MIDLGKQYSNIKGEIEEAINSVLSESKYILGPEVRKFETELADYCGSKYAIGVASGTDALFLSMLALGVKQDDEVITTDFSFIATANTISHLGAKPVFVDVNPYSFNIDVKKIECKITNKTKAIIPVHLFGYPANMDEIIKLSNEYNLYVIEDAAQAIGASINGRKVGTYGTCGVFSFFPTKNLGAYGDGGAVITDDVLLAEKIDILRRQGSKKKYIHEVLGINSRLDTLQAAILIVKIKYLDKWISTRRKVAQNYKTLLGNTALILPSEESGMFHAYNQYTIRLPQKRDGLKQFLAQNGVESTIYYPIPLHLQPVFSFLNYSEGDFPISEGICEHALSIPCYPELPYEDQFFICNKIKEFLKKEAIR